MKERHSAHNESFKEAMAPLVTIWKSTGKPILHEFQKAATEYTIRRVAQISENYLTDNGIKLPKRLKVIITRLGLGE